MNYIHQLAPLRFFAAIIIVFLHFGNETFPFNYYPLDRLIFGGFSALSFFFFLSGFVLSYNYIGDNLLNVKSFYLKRFARVYPMYILAAVMTLILGMLILDMRPKGLSIILQMLGIQAWIPSMAVGLNFPGWTVSVEIAMYFIFPFVVLIYKRFGLTKFTIFTLLFWLLSCLLHFYFLNNYDLEKDTLMHHFILYFPVWHFNGFLFGVLGGIYVKSEKLKGVTNFTKWRLWYVLGTITLLLIIYNLENGVHYIHNGLLIPLYFIICSGISMDNSKLTRLLSKPFFTELGNVSYSVYILQYPIFIVFIGLADTENLSTLYFYFYLISLLAISFVTHKYFENKARNFIVNRNIVKKEF